MWQSSSFSCTYVEPPHFPPSSPPICQWGLGVISLGLADSVLPDLLWLLQSYGIKVGYGAGGTGPQTVKPGEGAAGQRSSGCC
mmetsp:Transcript_2596/g.7366  ORF Transcript_2596/g.7366 Transcript_2596/m.7366 type:complete len:83 (-) Transcript_2596:121-369(-)